MRFQNASASGGDGALVALLEALGRPTQYNHMKMNTSHSPSHGFTGLPTTFRLKSGYDIPLFGFGTWAEGAWEGTAGDWCKQATIEALKIGYRHIDTARNYACEDAVGDAIRESGVPREEVFVTTKMYV